ncbi:hypothetical protein OU995_06890 [Roseateles sp. SL47]|uniref:hypothetical protein n=1 Tax=Roseateles sp. SL47 TaxID=2995138 RepID=UPI002270E565|nr:hypothetical protein [Roseateles sp. SL47]WAC74439.1 hypothetical protein OU995_06890 [Roseateles sp. SL47]
MFVSPSSNASASQDVHPNPAADSLSPAASRRISVGELERAQAQARATLESSGRADLAMRAAFLSLNAGTEAPVSHHTASEALDDSGYRTVKLMNSEAQGIARPHGWAQSQQRFIQSAIMPLQNAFEPNQTALLSTPAGDAMVIGQDHHGRPFGLTTDPWATGAADHRLVLVQDADCTTSLQRMAFQSSALHGAAWTLVTPTDVQLPDGVLRAVYDEPAPLTAEPQSTALAAATPQAKPRTQATTTATGAGPLTAERLTQASRMFGVLRQLHCESPGGPDVIDALVIMFDYLSTGSEHSFNEALRAAAPSQPTQSPASSARPDHRPAASSQTFGPGSSLPEKFLRLQDAGAYAKLVVAMKKDVFDGLAGQNNRGHERLPPGSFEQVPITDSRAAKDQAFKDHIYPTLAHLAPNQVAVFLLPNSHPSLVGKDANGELFTLSSNRWDPHFNNVRHSYIQHGVQALDTAIHSSKVMPWARSSPWAIIQPIHASVSEAITRKDLQAPGLQAPAGPLAKAAAKDSEPALQAAATASQQHRPSSSATSSVTSPTTSTTTSALTPTSAASTDTDWPGVTDVALIHANSMFSTLRELKCPGADALMVMLDLLSTGRRDLYQEALLRYAPSTRPDHTSSQLAQLAQSQHSWPERVLQLKAGGAHVTLQLGLQEHLLQEADASNRGKDKLAPGGVDLVPFSGKSFTKEWLFGQHVDPVINSLKPDQLALFILPGTEGALVGRDQKGELFAMTLERWGQQFNNTGRNYVLRGNDAMAAIEASRNEKSSGASTWAIIKPRAPAQQ